MHKGNITNIGFINSYDMLYSISGSFSNNHDNSLIIMNFEMISNEVFINKIKLFANLHGKQKGILSSICSNKKDDYYLFTGGGSDNNIICLIDTNKMTKIYSFAIDRGIYYMNLISGIYLNKFITERILILENNNDSQIESKYLKLLIINSITEVIIIIIYANNTIKFHKIFDIIKLKNQNGSYFRVIQLYINNALNTINILTSNIKGNVEQFILN